MADPRSVATGRRRMAADYRAVLEHFRVEGGILVGHSMGAFLSVTFCLHHPEVVRERLAGMVLVGGHAGAAARGSLQNRLQIPLVASGVIDRLVRSPRVGRLFARSLFGKSAPEVFLEACRRGVVQTNVSKTIAILEAMVREDHYARLGEISVPTRVLCGELDRTCPRWHSERLGLDIRNARNIWLPRVGHMVVYEKPYAIVNEIEALAHRPSMVRSDARDCTFAT